MTETASEDLCQELYELLKWGDSDKERSVFGDLDWWPDTSYEGFGVRFLFPKYTLGYLLRKLPKRSVNIEDTVLLGRSTDNSGWSIVYRDVVCIEKTPEDAAAQLAIALAKAGVLKKGEEDD